MAKKYDVIIVGAGPAGIFAAIELSKEKSAKVLLVEKGSDLQKRGRNSVNSGWGGSGAFSDGKLILSTVVGGWLSEYVPLEELDTLISYIDSIYEKFGGATERHGTDVDRIKEFQRQAVMADLVLVPAVVRHLGTDRCVRLLKEIRRYLDEKKVEIRTEVEALRILVGNGRAHGVELRSGDQIEASNVIIAPGRAGAHWLVEEAQRLGLTISNNQVDIGVRVEVPAPIAEPLTKDLYESKLIYHSKSFEDEVRTFCMNPYGVVTTEVYNDNVVTVNGHSYARKKTANTNFALLASTTFTEPFKEPIAYGKYIARLANLLGEGIIIQRLGDLQIGRRSTPDRIRRGTVVPTLKSATPGDLSFALPYRYISDILEMLQALDKIAPGINSRNTLLYGVEAKFYSSRPKLDANLQTEIKNLYAIGDGAGITRGLVQASVAGVIAARSIIKGG
ncbi:MAG: FAD-dependent oxidoreductase [Actinomycetota bacterium]